MKNENVNNIVSIVLKVIPLAMGAAVAVLSVMQQLTPQAGLGMLGLGMFCGALGQLKK